MKICITLDLENSGGPLDDQTWQKKGWPQQKLPKFGFRTHTTALWPMEQSSILSAKSDCQPELFRFSQCA